MLIDCPCGVGYALDPHDCYRCEECGEGFHTDECRDEHYKKEHGLEWCHQCGELLKDVVLNECPACAKVRWVKMWAEAVK